MWGTRNKTKLPISIQTWNIDEATFWRIKGAIRKIAGDQIKYADVWRNRCGIWWSVGWEEAVGILCDAKRAAAWDRERKAEEPRKSIYGAWDGKTAPLRVS